ncbi:unnamed protein product [Cyclocybe aegerita]|uniref:Uncharacterized protein n=1 Tax=Cyclocybe aegerita TaxID=1973307 RepID=A0A8S0WH37_CYCAE|nr:unnamed protein product [Cyclocybe aegerita]
MTRTEFNFDKRKPHCVLVSSIETTGLSVIDDAINHAFYTPNVLKKMSPLIEHPFPYSSNVNGPKRNLQVQEECLPFTVVSPLSLSPDSVGFIPLVLHFMPSFSLVSLS